MRGLVDATLAAFGRIDVLVNNAGSPASPLVLHTMLDEWNRVSAVDLTGASCSRACRAHDGRADLWGDRQHRLPAWATAARLTNLAAYLVLLKVGETVYEGARPRARAARDSRRVNAVAPGPVDTPILDDVDKATMAGILAEIPLGWVARVEEIVPVVVLLAATPARTPPRAGSSTFPGDT